MKNSFFLMIINFLLIAVISGSSLAPADKLWLTDMDEAMAKARNSDKQVLIYFSGSDWCKPCIKLKKTVFESSAFQEFALKHFVLVQADFPRLKKNKLSDLQTSHNEHLADKYNPTGEFPLVVLVHPENGSFKKTGYRSLVVDRYLQHLLKMMQN